MTSPRYSKLAATLLANSRPEGSPPAPTRDARARAIAAIERAVAEKSRARTRARLVYGIAAAATVALMAGGATFAVRGIHDAPKSVAQAVVHPRGGVVVSLANEESPAQDGATLGRGSRVVVAPQGRATLAFTTGTQMTLEERGDLTILGEGSSQRFSLGGGSVQANVAKLTAGQRFVIATDDAEVEVRGTSFTVAVVPSDASCGDGTTTRVDVREGTVLVRHAGVEVYVAAGEHWPTGPGGCAAFAVNRDEVSPPRSMAVATSPPPDASIKSGPLAPSATAASHLAAQNDLFADALAAKRRGASTAAIALFDRFLARYPSSPLGESAMAERMKLVHTRAAAQQYLALYPNGFARREAQAILAEGHP